MIDMQAVRYPLPEPTSSTVAPSTSLSASNSNDIACCAPTHVITASQTQHIKTRRALINVHTYDDS